MDVVGSIPIGRSKLMTYIQGLLNLGITRAFLDGPYKADIKTIRDQPWDNVSEHGPVDTGSNTAASRLFEIVTDTKTIWLAFQPGPQ